MTKEKSNKEDFWVECNVCKVQLKNWVGSTPCCGSIAYIIEKGKKTKTAVFYAEIKNSNEN